MRPVGIELDRLPPEEAIAEGSPYWNMLGQFVNLGLSPGTLSAMSRHEQSRMVPIIYEELGYGDSGSGISLAAGSLASLLSHYAENQALRVNKLYSEPHKTYLPSNIALTFSY